MSRFIDKRANRNKSAVNRQRFLRRFKSQVQKAVSDAVTERSITDMDNGETINIPKRDISEPHFQHGPGGVRDLVLPGNREFSQGDKLQRPPSQAGEGTGTASDEGEGEDNFAFSISREEFLDIFFEDLALPNLTYKEIARVPTYKRVRAGFTQTGIPTNVNIVRSLRGAMARRIGMGSKKRKQLRQLELQLAECEEETERQALQLQIQVLKRKLAALPFIDPIDLRYNNHILQPAPSTQAVMFCIMDVSGSMDEVKKDIAKRFFILLYLFLTRSYDKIELVFIRHHTSAKEVSEEAFFYSRETGGTVVSSALELMHHIMQERYPSHAWNIYAAQASDGDNWNNDSPRCSDWLIHHIMPQVQFFSYIEILPRHHQSLWEAYLAVQARFPNFAMESITSAQSIYPVFHDLFKKQVA